MAKILLVEPDLLLAESTAGYLKSLGHEVNWQSEAQSAVNSADQTKPELVILELQLASHSGVEFLYEFRSYPEWQTVPIIIYSSVDTSTLDDSGMLFGPLDIAESHQKHATTLNQLGQSVSRVLASQTA